MFIFSNQVENREEAVGSLQERIHESQEESRVLQARLEVIERRVKELEDSNRELTAQVARKEEALHQLHVCHHIFYILAVSVNFLSLDFGRSLLFSGDTTSLSLDSHIR